MPFLRGTAPIRRTLEYLEKGKLVFKVMQKYLQSIDHNFNSFFFSCVGSNQNILC